ncbi:MAG: GntR family transcriptional regulator, partial [Chloroflexi bacterium]|nr:GntR family transcriptional regulator [Chloroflexota bacterium]
MSANDQGSVSKNVSTILSRKARVKKRSLADQVAETLREAIIRNDLEPGMRLVELEIAQQMGMSQAPVREALQRLEQDGLVERRSRSATYVSEISMDEMYEINLVRKLVETLAICQTAENITTEQCDQLEQLVGQMKEAADCHD